MRTLHIVNATTWKRETHPTEGWIAIDDKPREFKTRAAAQLYVVAMTAADDAAARRNCELNRTTYTITEEPAQ